MSVNSRSVEIIFSQLWKTTSKLSVLRSLCFPLLTASPSQFSQAEGFPWVHLVYLNPPALDSTNTGESTYPAVSVPGEPSPEGWAWGTEILWVGVQVRSGIGKWMMIRGFFPNDFNLLIENSKRKGTLGGWDPAVGHCLLSIQFHLRGWPSRHLSPADSATCLHIGFAVLQLAAFSLEVSHAFDELMTGGYLTNDDKDRELRIQRCFGFYSPPPPKQVFLKLCLRAG